MKNIIIILITICFIWFILAISGCGVIKQTYVRSGTSQSQAQRDMTECEMYGRAHSNMNPFMAIDLIGRCMTNKGYYLE